LTRLARLRQLSGDTAGAAANWLDAATVLPGEPGDAAIVAGAYCLAAIGEWGNAALALRPLLASNRRGQMILRARYLDACLRTWTSDNAATLAALANDPEFAGMKPTIYYTLWRTLTGNSQIAGAGSAESWKTRLLAEFPSSPEARLVNPVAGSPSVSAVQRPLWLLAPETGLPEPSMPQTAPSVAAPPQVAPAMPVISQIAPPPAAPSQPTPAVRPVENPVPQAAPSQPTPVPQARPVAPVAPANSGPVLQTGVFGREANARNMAEQLQRAGFTPTISRRPVNGTEHWIVTVPGGPDPNKTAQDLGRAGFDSFPVRGNNN
jgi:cell division septation protein DedD